LRCVELNFKDHHGNTALHKAAELGSVGVCRLLIASGANPSMSNSLRNRPIDVANPLVTKVLQEEEPIRSNLDVESQLLEAARDGDLDTVKVCLHVHVQFAGHQCRSRHACATGCACERCIDSAFIIISSSFQRLCTPHNVNCCDMKGRYSTPLHFAAGFNRVTTVEYLLQKGADVHARDKGYAHLSQPF